jgi:hypothetical protein
MASKQRQLRDPAPVFTRDEDADSDYDYMDQDEACAERPAYSAVAPLQSHPSKDDKLRPPPRPARHVTLQPEDISLYGKCAHPLTRGSPQKLLCLRRFVSS